MKKDIQITVRIPAELRDKLQALADADHRKLAAYITLVLERHVAISGGDQR
ncbi:MAG: Arc family DNA-binding protein [Hyphomicrobiaceae bacterium]